MKKVVLLCVTVASLNATIPYYTGMSLTKSICKDKMEMFYDNESLFDEMIRDNRIVEARTIAWDIERYYDMMVNKYYESGHYCKSSMSKAEYKKWFTYVKRKRDELKRKGWFK